MTEAKEDQYESVVPFLASVIKHPYTVGYVFVEHEFNFYQKYGKALSNLRWDHDRSLLSTIVMCEKKAEDLKYSMLDYKVFAKVDKQINMENVKYWIEKFDKDPGVSTVVGDGWSISYAEEHTGKELEAEEKSIYF